jgi:hypothetical protein
MDQEIAHRNNLGRYRSEFEKLVAKGYITRDDRNNLNFFARKLSLTAEDIRTIESSFRFRDESVETR